MQDLTPSEPLHPTARELAAPASGLQRFPPVSRWDDWEELDPKAWPSTRGRAPLPGTPCLDGKGMEDSP